MISNFARPPRLSPPQADDGGQGFRIDKAWDCKFFNLQRGASKRL